jgi:ATP-dependent DNA helicase RecQ
MRPQETSGDALRHDLTRLFGHDDFRPGQREIVESALEGRDTLAIMPTGGGKSLTFQLPAMLLPGVTLVLSPLIALMKDQAENLPPTVAPHATVINSSLDMAEMARRMERLRSGRLKMVYAAPERLRQPTFLHALRRADVSLVVVDEAHCISQWGHDFRPDYRAVGKAVEALAPRSVLAVTATATPEIADDIERQLGRPLHRIVRPTYRDNLFLSCRKVQGEDDKLWATLDTCQNTDGAGLVYAGSREKCEQLARMLKRQGVSSGFYHAGLPPEERAAAQDRFMSGEVRVMAATVAFGMGVDKSDIRFIVHYHPSRNLENYYQEAGRAGRDGELSTCMLLYSSADAANASRYLREDTLMLDGIRAVYRGVQRVLSGRRMAPVPFDALTEAAGGEESAVRSTLPLLEEAELLVRHVDIPRRFALYPDQTGDGKAALPEWEAFETVIGTGGEFPAAFLSQETGVPLPQIEETLLRFRDAGYVSLQAAPRDLLIELLPAPADTRRRMEEMLVHRAGGARSRVEAMRDYARENTCRHAAIARYFGDRWPHRNCGRCDVCTGAVREPTAAVAARVVTGNTAPAVDVKTAPFAALSIVHDLTLGNYPFALGKAGLVRALRGTPDAPIKPGRTRAFGALASLKKAEVERLVDALVEAEYVRRDEEDEYRRLYLTDNGAEAIQQGEIDLEWRLTPVASVAPSKGAKAAKAETLPEDVDPVLFEALRAWRREEADLSHVPPYVVFADKVLAALAARKPSNEFDLQAIPGIGPVKAAKYGPAILEAVRKHGGV